MAGGSPGSPDLSTSSLLSCSEHYQGESLLENLAVSPQTPSSPETPEWSLLANGESFHKVRRVCVGWARFSCVQICITVG